MNPSKEQIDFYLQKILESRYFKKSKISCDILSYIVDATLKGEDPKEYTIGLELFGKKYKDDSKQDSNTRVYIHNVRKRLLEYYDHEGEKDEFYFEIEKGKYRINFITPKSKRSNQKYLIPFVVSLAVVLILGIILILDTGKKKNHWEKSRLWSAFDNGKKNVLVLGDYFVIASDLSTGGSGIIRDFSINSEEDFNELLLKKPELTYSLSKSNLTYLSKMASFCQNDIERVFGYLNQEIDVILLSDLQPDDLKDYNIIFVGNYKNLGILESIITEIEFPYSILAPPQNVIISNDPCTEDYQPSSINDNQIDYAIVFSQQGFSQNHYLFFLSSIDIGNISTVSIFTQEDALDEFENKYLKQKEKVDFKALYKVQGINKTDLSYELLRVD